MPSLGYSRAPLGFARPHASHRWADAKPAQWSRSVLNLGAGLLSELSTVTRSCAHEHQDWNNALKATYIEPFSSASRANTRCMPRNEELPRARIETLGRTPFPVRRNIRDVAYCGTPWQALARKPPMPAARAPRLLDL